MRWINAGNRLVCLVGCGAVIGGLSAGCSREGGRDNEEDGSLLRERLAALERQAEELDDAAGGLRSFQRSKELLNDAVRLLEEESAPDAARRKLTLAASQLERARRESRETERLAERVAALEKRLRLAQKTFESSREDASEELADAERLLSRGARLRRAGDPGSLLSAERELHRAAELFEAAKVIAANARRGREEVAAERESLEALRKEAKELDIAQRFPADWLRAEQLERDAKRNIEDANWDQAVRDYRSAQNMLAGAIQMARIIDLAPEGPAITEGSLRPGDARRGPAVPPSSADERSVPPPPPSPPAAATSRILRLTAEATPYMELQETSAEEEAFLAENISALSQAITYDPTTGAVVLDYTDGRLLKRDAIVGSVPRDHLRFDDPILRAGANDPLYSFEANTGGSFLLPVPFRFLARAEWSTQVQMLDQNGTFGTLVCLDTKSSSGFIVEGVHLGVTLRGAPPRWIRRVTSPPFHRKLSGWFEKKRPIAQRAEYAMTPPSDAREEADRRRREQFRGRLVATYDAGGEMEFTTASDVVRLHRGLVGFTWKRARFQVRNLIVEGILDKERALEILRQRLGGSPRSEDPGTRRTTRTVTGASFRPSPPGGVPRSDTVDS